MAVDSPKLRLLAFASEGVFSSVLDSQVLVPLAHVGRQAPGIRRALLILTGMRHRKNPAVAKRQQAIRAALPGVSVIFRYRLPSPMPLEHRLWAAMLRAAAAQCGYAGPDPIVVHCRGEITAAAAVTLKRRDPRIRVLLDVRGALVDELAGRGLRAWYCQRACAAALARALAGADGLNTVSHKLAEHLQQIGGLRPGVPSTVIGCCADTERFYFDPAQRAARRKELGFDGKFVICYLGSMAHWQRPDLVAEAFAAIQQDMPDAHMFILSGEPGPLLAQLRRVGVEPGRITARSAPHDQVATYLMAADVGLLLRENTLTNRVASPVKFAEYLRCGLPVILTPYIGDLSALARAEGVGQVIDFPVQADQAVQAARALRSRLEREGDAGRAACSGLAAKQFSWDAQAGRLTRLYETLARQ